MAEGCYVQYRPRRSKEPLICEWIENQSQVTSAISEVLREYILRHGTCDIRSEEHYARERELKDEEDARIARIVAKAMADGGLDEAPRQSVQPAAKEPKAAPPRRQGRARRDEPSMDGGMDLQSMFRDRI